MNVTMPAWLLAVTFVVSVAVGYASCYFGVVKIGTAVMGLSRPDSGKANTMTDEQTEHRRSVTVPFVIITALVAMLLVLATVTGVGYYRAGKAADEKAVEQAAAAKAQSEYAACLTTWGDDLVGTINHRNDARAAYDDASQHRDDATAKVLRVALELFVTPPTATRGQFKRTLEQARRADERVTAAKATLDSTQTDYEAPTFACGADPSTDQQGDTNP